MPFFSGRLQDATSGRPIVGFEWREALRHGARQLMDLLTEEAPHDSPGE